MTMGLEAVVNDTYNYKTPLTGTNVTLLDEDWYVVLDPAAGIAALTVTMCPIPLDGQVVNVRTSQTITALTVAANAGQVIANGAPVTLAAGTKFTAIYKASNTTWYVAT